jgi:thiosulfate dehydrogenase
MQDAAQRRQRFIGGNFGRAVVLSTLGVLLQACGPLPAEQRGQALASDPRLSPSPSNVFACTSCHAVSDGPDPRLLPGYSLRGALNRPSFWGGDLHYDLDAVNQCLVDFMRGTTLTADDPDGRALLAYLQTLAPAATPPEPALPCTVVRNIDSTYLAQMPVGDATRGASLYPLACGNCHGSLHTGDGRIGPYVSLIPDATLSSFGAAQAPAVIIEKARHGRYFGISGAMPFFCTEVLNDGQLSDLVAYLLK